MTGSNRSGAVAWPVVIGGFALAAAIATVTVMMTSPRESAFATPSPNMADSLIGLWIDSVGGMERYHEFQSAQFTVATVLYDTLTGRIKRNRPRYAWIKKGPYGEETRVERWETYGFIEQGFNGTTSWALLDGAVLPDTTKDGREALYVSRDLFYWMGLPFKLRDPGVILTYRGKVSRPGAEVRDDPTAAPVQPPADAYHAVAVSFEAGVGEHQDVFTYYFLPGAGFPIEVTYVEEGRTSLNRATWGPTERAGEIRYPYPAARDFMTESGKRTKTLLIYDVVINADLPQELFDPPAETS